MASDFAPVQPQYLNLGQILGQVEDIKSSRMQQQLFQQRMQAMQQEQARLGQLRGLYQGPKPPTPDQISALDPEFGYKVRNQQIDAQNAGSLQQQGDHKLFKDAAVGAMTRWKATGNNPEMWPAIMHDVRRQLHMATGGRLGADESIEKFTPEMVSQFAAYEDPDVTMQRNAQAEGLKAEAKAGAEFPYKVAESQAKPQRAAMPRPVDPSLQQKRQMEIDKMKREEREKESGMNLTESQAKHTNYALRMQEAEKILQGLEADGYSPTVETIYGRAKGKASKMVGGSKYAGLTKNGQKWDQAQDQWVNALLRSDTGAAYAGYEPEDLKDIFFAQPGEGDEIKAQKAAQRKAAMEGMLISAGRGRQQVEGYGQKPAADSGGYSIEDLQHTAEKYGMTIEEVKAKLGAQ